MKKKKIFTYIIVLLLFVLLGGILLDDIIKDTEASTETTYANKINMNAVEYISNLYNNNAKTVVSNKEIDYNYATSVSLMDDNFGNIRYYGETPNNYIDIGDVYEQDLTVNKWESFGWNYDSTEACYKDNDCDTYYADWGYDSPQACYDNGFYPSGIYSVEDVCGTTLISKGTPILYRIIGVFDGKLKVIRADSIGSYSWDTSESNGINDWSQADIMKLLNPGYESEIVDGSLWWNSQSGTCYNGKSNATTSCDFSAIGLSDNVKDIISEGTWYVGGAKTSFIAEAYKEENSKSWTGKVGLMNLSDYGFATDFDKCEPIIWTGPVNSNTNHEIVSTFLELSNSLCSSNNWLYNEYEWLLTSSSLDSYKVWYMYYNSSYSQVLANAGASYYSYRVRPVMYLMSDVNIKSGDGSEDNPYVIGNLYSATINYYYLEDGKETTKKINDSYVLNGLEDGYTEVVVSPKIEGCKASKDVTIEIDNSDFTDNVYYSCDIMESPPTGTILTFIMSIIGISAVGYLVYYYLRKNKLSKKA